MTGDVSRADLFDWDASARAWLRVADQVMKKQQTQARLIIDNLDIPVNSKPDTYNSVVDAWASSMMQMEKLLCGIPLQVHRGDILLGLLSWHLYPDMKCLFATERFIEQNDSLLKGRGVLTLGLEPSPRVIKDPQSVYWALPLAHLRYYGRLPVTRVKTLRTTQRDRLTIDEMLWAIVSSYIGPWHDASISMQSILQFVSNVAIELHFALGYDTCPSTRERHSWVADQVPHHTHPSWLTMLSRVCLQNKDRLHEERIRKLQALGRRLPQSSSKIPFNGIFNVETYLRVGRSTERKITLLREVVPLNTSAGKAPKPGCYEYLIVFKRAYSTSVNRSEGSKQLELFEFATVFPEYDDENFDSQCPAFSFRYGRRKANQVYVTVAHARSVERRTQKKAEESEVIISMYTHRKSKAEKHAEYVVVSGNLESIALLRRRDMEPIIHQSTTHVPSSTLTSVDFTECATYTRINDITLQATTLVESLYSNMNGATIDVRAVGFNFASAKWIRQALKLPRHDIMITHTQDRGFIPRLPSYLHAADSDTATCFSCIATMETGTYNLDPDTLKSVFGLCASDSLYIASCLLRDPVDRMNGPPIQRFTGNIGRAGMAFMVPPTEPEIRRYDFIDEWYQYDHHVYTGIMEDCFEGTNLQLSFSDASQAVNANFFGGPDVEAYFLETLVSVYNRGEWIAELDVLGSSTHPNLKSEAEILKGKACSCANPTQDGPTIISIDNFVEMLVPPTQPGIVRAKGNWQARLAATALCLAKGYKVVIKGPNTCLKCVLSNAEDEGAFPDIYHENADVLMII
ncbi:hypothetical protein F4808DRAFT_450297 [Astrocystis sublimbata]|nr:hypothetical protein F4808DRAFT_450297 [Astrocystis sublimbata]